MNKAFELLVLMSFVLCAPDSPAEAAPAGYVIGWGYNVSGAAEGKYSTGTVAVPGQVLSNVVAISAGKYYALALKSDDKGVGSYY